MLYQIAAATHIYIHLADDGGKLKCILVDRYLKEFVIKRFKDVINKWTV